MHTVSRRIAILCLSLLLPAAAVFAAPAPDALAGAITALERDDPSAALPLVKPLADGGHADAQHLLGFMHDLGLGVPFDPDTGTRWQERAAASGHYWASLYLAWKCRLGFGLDAPDPARAEPLESIRYTRTAPERVVPAGWLGTTSTGFQPNFSRAALWLRAQAAARNGSAAANLAQYSLLGLSGRPNADEHMRWLTAAADAGDAPSLERLSIYHAAGLLGLAKNPELSLDYLRRAATAGLASAQYTLGRKYARGDGVTADAATAANWYRQAAAQDHIDAINRLADLLRKGLPPAPPDYAEALTLSRRAAKLGSAEGLSDVAGMLRRGHGTAKDLPGALQLYREAAEKGSAFAAHMVGWMITYGEAGERDYAEARRWFERAAKGGYDGAMREIGLQYAEGRGTAVDQAEAFTWFERAAREGDAWAQNRAGWMLLNGTGIAKDPEEAITWFTLAAKQDDTNALINLGNCHEQGNGTEINLSLAANYYRQALALREKRAAFNLASVALKDSGPEQRQLFAEITPLLATDDASDEAWARQFRGLVLLHANNPLRDEAAGALLLETLPARGPLAVITLMKHYGKIQAWAKMRACLEGVPEPKDPAIDYYLGLVHLAGIGGPPDAAMGIAALRRGPKESALVLAYCHYLGIGTPKDDRAAFMLLEQAAKHGEPRAKEALAKPSQAEALATLLPGPPKESARIPIVHDDGRPNARPRLITSVAPIYPFLLGRLGITGSAKVEFVVDEVGVPTDFKLIEATLPDFGAAAIAAISQWRLSPGKKDGNRVKTRMSQVLEFNLEAALFLPP